MNGLYARRLDYIQGVMWILQDQLEEARRLAPAVPELNLVVVTLILKTLPTVRG
jgi:hypothetical protein